MEPLHGDDRVEQKGTEIVEIADDVIQVIAGLAASRTEGVVAMSGGVAGGIAERLGRKNMSKGVKAEIADGQVAIDVYIIAKYGVQLDQLFRQVQKNVKEAVENMTGLVVERVNVHTQGLAMEEESTDDDGEEE